MQVFYVDLSPYSQSNFRLLDLVAIELLNGNPCKM
jgi:hypothetical protein